ncbi:hypothetical protein J6590_048007 [Homalodisca vitripennis]|nr:hypothetical protein J6590_048007 [Homalodisca vitripennis]
MGSSRLCLTILFLYRGRLAVKSPRFAHHSRRTRQHEVHIYDENKDERFVLAHFTGRKRIRSLREWVSWNFRELQFNFLLVQLLESVQSLQQRQISEAALRGSHVSLKGSKNSRRRRTKKLKTKPSTWFRRQRHLNYKN